jgi:hypothetical protein
MFSALFSAKNWRAYRGTTKYLKPVFKPITFQISKLTNLPFFYGEENHDNYHGNHLLFVAVYRGESYVSFRSTGRMQEKSPGEF